MSVATPEPSMPSRLSRRPAVSMIRRLVSSLCSFAYRTTSHAPYPRCEYDHTLKLSGHDDDNDLARLRAPLLDVGHRLECFGERERPVDDRAQLPLVVEGTEVAQLGAVGLHEEELVPHAQGLGLLAHL